MRRQQIEAMHVMSSHAKRIVPYPLKTMRLNKFKLLASHNLKRIQSTMFSIAKTQKLHCPGT